MALIYVGKMLSEEAECFQDLDASVPVIRRDYTDY